jgi:formate/nitrite transporter FocA (FNT family)
VGTFLAAAACTFTPAVSDITREEMLALSRHATQYGWLEMGVRAVVAGYLMATMVWLIPGAGASQFQVVGLLTYLIGAGSFPHIVAGSMEASMLLLHGESAAGDVLRFALPTLAGNVIGGTVLFAMLAHAQVMKAIP